ncbi:MAG: hypothetical protein H6912_02000 [Kordiimonadaceae bacterium]|nr:hypothetical protein [Kordiimonadaceae bacterium]
MPIKRFLKIIFSIYLFFNSVSYAQDNKTGSFLLKSTSADIIGEEAAEQYKVRLDPHEEITWQIYVPENYDPSNPPGVLLYQTYGTGPNDPLGWRAALEEKNLILVRLRIGGKLIEGKEMLLGVLSLPLLQSKYNINTSRVYNTAENGCIVAGLTSKYYANIFKGSIFVNCVPASWKNDIPEQLELMKQNRYLFIYSPKILKSIGIRQTIRRYNEYGINKTKLESTSRLDSGDNLDRRLLNSAIDYLDGIN